jgi:hypothetical protein
MKSRENYRFWVGNQALSSTLPQEKPRAILLGSLPDPGKDTLEQVTIHEFRPENGGVVAVTENRLPLNMNRRDVSTAEEREIGEQWRAWLLDDAVVGKRNLVIDGLLEKPELALQVAEYLKSAGYEIEIRAKVEPMDLSFAKASLCFEHKLAETGFALMPQRTHFAEMLVATHKSIQLLEEKKLFDTVRLYSDSNKAPFYENRLENGQWKDPVTVTNAYRANTLRPLNLMEHQTCVVALNEALELAKKRHGIEQNYHHYVVGSTHKPFNHFESPLAAALAFHNIPAQHEPYIRREEGHQQYTLVGLTRELPGAPLKKYIIADSALASAHVKAQAFGNKLITDDYLMLKELLARAKENLSQFNRKHSIAPARHYFENKLSQAREALWNNQHLTDIREAAANLLQKQGRPTGELNQLLDVIALNRTDSMGPHESMLAQDFQHARILFDSIRDSSDNFASARRSVQRALQPTASASNDDVRPQFSPYP